MVEPDDPWVGLGPSSAPDSINARRIIGIGSDAWGLYWGVDSLDHCLLILQFQTAQTYAQRLPRLRGLVVENRVADGGSGQRLIVRLTDNEQREIFHRFCLDVKDATSLAKSEDDAVARFITRTRSWNRLLRSGSDSRLSDAEQMGLIGELRLVESHLLVVLPVQDVVSAWVGPFGASKDFQFGLVCVEAKAMSPQKAEIIVASIDQLDESNTAKLLLYVSEVGSAGGESPTALTVLDMASRVRKKIAELDVSALMMFEDRMSALGFDWDDDYSDKSWEIGRETVYEILGDFPRVTPRHLISGVKEVTYAIDLTKCEDFKVEVKELRRAILGNIDEC